MGHICNQCYEFIAIADAMPDRELFYQCLQRQNKEGHNESQEQSTRQGVGSCGAASRVFNNRNKGLSVVMISED